MNNITDIEDYKTTHLLLHDEKNYSPQMNDYIIDLINTINNYINNNNCDSLTDKEWKKLNTDMRKKYHVSPGIVYMNYLYRYNIENNIIKPCKAFEDHNIGKQVRTTSGITQVTVLSSPYPNGQTFSCEHNCYYCPNEPAHEGNDWTPQPRSYVYHEPAVHRANMNKFDGANQVWDRLSTLSLCGLPIDKVEMMVLGGTWGSYPTDYRIEFIRDLYYACNTFFINKDNRRERLSMEEEININMTTHVRIIGLTLETRPDHVTVDELKLMREMNCTRVQIGVQHTDDRILKKVNRGCYLKDTKRAIYNLLNVGLKVDVHLMFDLPDASPEDDKKMVDMMLSDEELRGFDQAKLYPFASMDWTVTKKWEEKGEYLHYSPEELDDVLIYAKSKIPPWVRLNRVIRDIPTQYISAGCDVPNMRQLLEDKMKTMGIKCKCIRCREVKNKKTNVDEAKMFVRKYTASGGTEFFISFESPDNSIIYGFCRLRLSKEMGYINNIDIRNPNGKDKTINEHINLFPFLNDSAMIRELHVYGSMTPVNNNVKNKNYQHRGFGKKMMEKAEDIACMNNYNKMAVIAGVGARKYYEKLGYKLENNYMIKEIKNDYDKNMIIFTIIVVIVSIFITLLLAL